MKITVITISFNAASRMAQTIKSVIQQDYPSYEYIVVDGASTDGTVEIIRQYEQHITKWVSEPDTGIYQAMNKGVAMATGDYCIFMNAGDMFIHEKVLSEIAPHLDGDATIVMGNQVYVDNWKFRTYRKAPAQITRQFLYRDSLCHQASFIRTQDLRETPYDESLRMVADAKMAKEFLLRQGKRYKGVDIDVDFFFMDGLTYNRLALKAEEDQRVLQMYYSPEQIANCERVRLAYRKPWNIPRYFHFLARCWTNLYGRHKYQSLIEKAQSL